MSTTILINNPMSKINPVFYPFWMSKCNHKLAKGGRSSTKSSVVSIKLVTDKMEFPMSNEIVLRKVQNTLRKSVYSQIKWALIDLGVADQFRFTTNPLEIIHKEWGTGFYFSGSDDPEKLKSLKIPVGYVKNVWFEEMDAFDGEQEIDTIEDTFIRTDLPNGQEVTVWGTWNPPKNPFAWINDYVDKHRNDDDFCIHHSTYLDDKLGFNSSQLIRKIEKYKVNDENYYYWMYLGKVIGLGNNVYNMALFHEIDELPDDDYVAQLAYSIDVGHQTSATTCLCIGITGKGNVIVLDTYYYSPEGRTYKKAPSELSKDLHEFIKETASRFPEAPIIKRTIDSAEGGLRNQYYNDYGTRLHGVNKAMKKVTMVDYPQELLAQGRVFILRKKTNEIFITQHQQYRWDEKTIATSDPKVIKENDHTCDAFQYLCIDNKRLLGLKK